MHIKGSFWWNTHLNLLENFKSMESCNVGSGNTSFVGYDLWHNKCLDQCFPHFYTFIKNTQHYNSGSNPATILAISFSSTSITIGLWIVYTSGDHLWSNNFYYVKWATWCLELHVGEC
jgi:hypothetical protein